LRTPRVLVRYVLLIVLVVYVVIVCVFPFLVPCCHVRYAFRMTTMFASSWIQLFFKDSCLIVVFFVCMFAYRDALCLIYPMLPVYLYYPFLIDPLSLFIIDSLLTLLLFVFTRNYIVYVSLAFGVFNTHWLN
jgi:hypothetical protein